MTIPASAEKIGGRLPSADEKAAANQLRRILASHAAGDAKLRLLSKDASKPTEVTLTPGLSELLLDLLRHIGKGDAVTLVPVSQMLTTQQAADILNVSRPHLVSLLEKGSMKFELVGRHRRIAANDLFAFKHARDTERAAALSELAASDADLI